MQVIAVKRFSYGLVARGPDRPPFEMPDGTAKAYIKLGVVKKASGGTSDDVDALKASVTDVPKKRGRPAKTEAVE